MLRLTPEVAQKDLALVLGLTKQAVAEIVAKLEAKGFVEKIASEGDRRQVIVKLTDAGREAAEAAAEERDDAVAGLLEALSDEEVETFSELLGKLITNLEAKLGEDSEERKERIDEFWRHHGHEGHGHGRGRGCGCGGHGGHGGRGRGRCCR
ncbi:MAG: winged helix DNA-binding protein [Propionibacteriaceae bacterium]|nr:winged helix DNA-binding protein [Propionibacteriaceae bacterium]